MKKFFTEDEKIKIWVDYMVTQVALNTIPLELNTTNRKPEERVNKEDIVNVYTHFFTFNGGGPKYPIQDYDSFCCNGSVFKWYEKFSKRIF
jgi:hypothetical protein